MTRHGHSTPGLATVSPACTTKVPSSSGWWSCSPPPARREHPPQTSSSPQASRPNSALPWPRQDTPTRTMCTRKVAGHSAHAAGPCRPLLEAPVRRNLHSRSKSSCAHCTSNSMLCSQQASAKIRRLARRLRQPNAERPSRATRTSNHQTRASTLLQNGLGNNPCDSAQTSRTSEPAACCAICYAGATSTALAWS